MTTGHETVSLEGFYFRGSQLQSPPFSQGIQEVIAPTNDLLNLRRELEDYLNEISIHIKKVG